MATLAAMKNYDAIAPRRVAFLGLGVMGHPMAGHLACAGHQVTVYNRSPAKAQAWLAAHQGCGALHATTPREAAAGAELVFACVGNDDDLRSVTLGVDGAFSGMAENAVFVDHTTASAEVARELHQTAKTLGLHFVDAPVSGGQGGAVNGALTVMCGGDAPAFARARPVLEAFGKKIVHVGPVGAGHALKAVNNALLAVHIWSAAEGLAALAKAGVSASVALDVINASSGRSNATENLIPQRVVTRAFPRTFRLALLEKDVAIAADFVREQRVPSPVIQQIAELFRLARVELGEEADHVEAARVIERMSGIEIR